MRNLRFLAILTAVATLASAPMAVAQSASAGASAGASASGGNSGGNNFYGAAGVGGAYCTQGGVVGPFGIYGSLEECLQRDNAMAIQALCGHGMTVGCYHLARTNAEIAQSLDEYGMINAVMPGEARTTIVATRGQVPAEATEVPTEAVVMTNDGTEARVSTAAGLAALQAGDPVHMSDGRVVTSVVRWVY